ncbi:MULTISPECIES: sulfite exporter TauE/SafE family protein [unclassified Bacillus cereus group]|uniref:sulfite exporter TauE/SafE family protein n=1 Tax=unclassified Bacillus cereus group TaxID=2750818 RepID=UPI0022E0EFD0|nr:MULTISPECIES: sulfite exporter TauE/SafE family protein [unclassified Bacillus cereus group]MDA2146956.1 sulfite exporter TauE/SafE family protein [Bacillus cereus group sp. Bc248]MDA2174873.1 sulfite exporter TauE/SafE family protein [Bacillus cereus group sp. Bc247]MED3470390.1 sulfite exporter TauE/SafE family protein [Bacillus thuringiensis]
MSISIIIMGMVVGVLVGMTGIGGAALLTPFLLTVGITPSIAVGTDLLYNSITKMFGITQHWKQKTINFKLVRYLALGSIPSAIIAITTIHFLPILHQNREELLKYIIGYVLIVAAISIFTKTLFYNQSVPNYFQKQSLEQKKNVTIFIGAILGFVVGLTSVGSGSLFAIVMIYLYQMKISELVGTDITHAFILVTVASILNMKLGNVDYILTINLLIGSIPGVIIGSKLSSKIPVKPLQLLLALIIFGSGLKLVITY